MKDVVQIDTCLGYGDGIDVFYNEDKLDEAQDVVNEECDNSDHERETVVVVLDVPARRASLDEDGIVALKFALDNALKAFQERRKTA